MLTRTGDLAQSTYTTQLLLDAQTRSRATQIQISTGKVATQFSGIADGASRLVSAKDALQRIQQFQHQQPAGRRPARGDGELDRLAGRDREPA